jgi:hypothetical protein
MLLAVYGLRAGEVTQLRLDDFDWKGERAPLAIVAAKAASAHSMISGDGKEQNEVLITLLLVPPAIF